jgi:hypothetical protein
MIIANITNSKNGLRGKKLIWTEWMILIMVLKKELKIIT